MLNDSVPLSDQAGALILADRRRAASCDGNEAIRSWRGVNLSSRADNSAFWQARWLASAVFARTNLRCCQLMKTNERDNGSERRRNERCQREALRARARAVALHANKTNDCIQTLLLVALIAWDK